LDTLFGQPAQQKNDTTLLMTTPEPRNTRSSRRLPAIPGFDSPLI